MFLFATRRGAQMRAIQHRKSPDLGGAQARWLRHASVLILAFVAAGCAQVRYERTPVGKFAGRLNVEWIAPNLFVYRPDQVAPLTFTAADGSLVRPQLMYTDGG